VRDRDSDKVAALDGGANDYLSKPFSFRELVARVRARLRSAKTPTDVLNVGDLSYDILARRVTRQGKVISLTNKELAILEVLMRHPGRSVTRARLWETAWDGSFEVNSNVLDAHVSRLRRKVDAGRKSPLIQTVYGSGYRMEAPTPRP
jgi:DNA-binding response OmpR family regulator